MFLTKTSLRTPRHQTIVEPQQHQDFLPRSVCPTVGPILVDAQSLEAIPGEGQNPKGSRRIVPLGHESILQVSWMWGMSQIRKPESLNRILCFDVPGLCMEMLALREWNRAPKPGPRLTATVASNAWEPFII